MSDEYTNIIHEWFPKKIRNRTERKFTLMEIFDLSVEAFSRLVKNPKKPVFDYFQRDSAPFVLGEVY